MPLTVFPQRNFVADFLQAKCDFRWKSTFLRFWAPLGGIEATYDDHLRLIGKRVVDFALVLIELFFARCYGWGVRANIGSNSLQWGPVDPKFQEEVVAPTNHSSSQKTRLNDLSYGIKVWTDLSSALSQFTRLSDRRTYRRTAFSSLVRAGIPYSAEINQPQSVELHHWIWDHSTEDNFI